MPITIPTQTGLKTLSVFNPEKLLRHLKDHSHRSTEVLTVVKKIIDDGIQPIEHARQALRRQQPYQAIHQLHTLRGSVANLGATRVCLGAENIEQHIELKPEDHEYPLGLLVHLQQEFQFFLEEAEHWLNAQIRQQKEKHGHQSDIDPQQLQSLFHYLKEHNLKACDVFDEMHNAFQSRFDDESFKLLVRNISNLKFSDALTQL